MLPGTAGTPAGEMNTMLRAQPAPSRWFPERKPAPTPTKSSSEPTPQAMPNMVRNERSLCAHRLRKIWAKMSKNVRIIMDIIVPLRGMQAVEGALDEGCLALAVFARPGWRKNAAESGGKTRNDSAANDTYSIGDVHSVCNAPAY